MRNAVLCIRGYVGRDAEVSRTKNGKDFVRFSVGVPNFHKDGQTGEFVNDPTTWYSVLAFRDMDAVYKAVKKGTAVLVEGKPIYSVYEGEKSAHPTVSVTIFAELVALVCRDKKNAGDAGKKNAGSGYENGRAVEEGNGQDFPDFPDFGGSSDDELDIPF